MTFEDIRESLLADEFDCSEQLQELLDTGSVTVTVEGKQYVLAITVQEAS